jgi:hypothetical protein
MLFAQLNQRDIVGQVIPDHLCDCMRDEYLATDGQ